MEVLSIKLGTKEIFRRLREEEEVMAIVRDNDEVFSYMVNLSYYSSRIMVERYLYKCRIGIPAWWRGEFFNSTRKEQQEMKDFYSEHYVWIDTLENRDRGWNSPYQVSYSQCKSYLENKEWHEFMDEYQYDIQYALEVINAMKKFNLQPTDMLKVEPWFHLCGSRGPESPYYLSVEEKIELYILCEGTNLSLIAMLHDSVICNIAGFISRFGSDCLSELMNEHWKKIEVLVHGMGEFNFDKGAEYHDYLRAVNKNTWLHCNGRDNEETYHVRHFTKTGEESLSEVEKGFLKKFGRVPKLMKKIYSIRKKLDVNLVDNFSLVAFKSLEDKGLFETEKVRLCYAFKGEILAIKNLDKNILSAIATGPIEDPKYRKFMIKFSKHAKEKEIINIAKFWRSLDVTPASLKEARYILANSEAIAEMKRVENSYGFKLVDCRTIIKNTIITYEDIVVKVLDEHDPKQATLGLDTHCCQHLDGAGSSAMAYGIISQYGAFLGFYRGQKLLAQALLWESDGTLVLDNIETANGRDISMLENALRKWLSECQYANVQLGLGYADITIGEEINDRKDYVEMNLEGINFNVYSDAGRRNWLKKDGVVVC